MDEKQPRVSAIAIWQDKIIATGNDYDLLHTFGAAASPFGKPTLIDAGGMTLLPGLTDGHIHLEQYSLSRQLIDCETESLQHCLQQIAKKVSQTPTGEWIVGHGWNQNLWQTGFGTASDLDQQTNQHPVYLTAKSLHAGWANTYALKLAGIDDSRTDPAGGHIQRLENGQPSGILFESAMQLIHDILPKPTPEHSAQAITQAQPDLWRMGLTGVHDFDQSNCFSALQRLHQEKKLKLRVIKSIPLENLQSAISLGLQTGFGDELLRMGQIKCFADGALGPQTAAMIQPYLGESENRGILLLDAEQVYDIGIQAVSHGLGLAVHAIGDLANHEILNGYARLREYEQNTLGINSPRLRHRIEHVQLIHPQDAARLKQLAILASMQPIHAPSDMDMAQRFWGTRCSHAYAWRLQLTHGTPLVFGSDAPVESPNPFWGIHAAVTRQRQDGNPAPDGWIPEQKLSLQEALHAYTVAPAYAAGLENKTGRLAMGYLADLIVLENNPFQIEPQNLFKLQPRAAMLAGAWLFNDLDLH